jgi:hypothetical protein
MNGNCVPANQRYFGALITEIPTSTERALLRREGVDCCEAVTEELVKNSYAYLDNFVRKLRPRSIISS